MKKVHLISTLGSFILLLIILVFLVYGFTGSDDVRIERKEGRVVEFSEINEDEQLLGR